MQQVGPTTFYVLPLVLVEKTHVELINMVRGRVAQFAVQQTPSLAYRAQAKERCETIAKLTRELNDYKL